MTESRTISPQEPKQPKQPKKRKWLRRVAWSIAVIFLLGAIGLLVLQTDWAAGKVRSVVEDSASSALHHGRLEIGALDGNLFYRLTARDVRLFSRDSIVVSIDSVTAEYKLLSFLFGSFRVYDLDLIRPIVTARQAPDSTWDLLSLIPEDTTGVSESSPMGLRFDRVRLSNGGVTARFFSSRSDSTIHLSELDAALRDVYIEGGVFGSTLDRVNAQVTAPVAPDPVSISMRGEIGEDRLICSLCTIKSSRSNVSLEGYLMFPETTSLRGNLALRLDPLVLGDVAFVLPSVAPEETVTGEATAFGRLDSLSVHARLDFSSGALADLTATIRTGDTARVRVEGEMRRFDPSLLMRTEDLAGIVNSEIDVDLSGTALESVSGPVAFRIFDTKLNNVELRDGYLNGRFDAGTARIETRLFLPGVAFDAAGTITPFADTASYDLSGSIRGRGLSRYYRALSDLDAAEGSFKIKGRGTTLEAADAHASVHVTRLTGLQIDLGESRLDARVGKGNVDLDTQIGIRGTDGSDAGSIEFHASIAQSDGQWLAETGNLSVSNLNLSAVMAEAPDGLLSASGRVALLASADSLLRVSGSLSVSGALGPVTLASSLITAEFAEGAGAYDVDIASSIGDVRAAGSFESEDGEYRVTAQGRIFHVNVDTLVSARIVTDLTGTIAARSLLRAGRLASLSIEGRLEHSVVNDQPIEGALLTASLADSTLQFDVDVDLPNGSIAGEGSFRPFDPEPALDLRETSFRHVDLAAWLSEGSISTDLNGSGFASIAGTNINGEFRLNGSRVNRAAIRTGSVRLGLNDSTLELQTTVDFDRGSLNAVATAQLGRHDTTYQAVVRLQEVDVAGLVAADSLASNLNAGCSIVGSNFSRPRLEASALCTARNSMIGAARIDSMRMEARIDSTALVLDSLSLRSNIGTLAGSGSIPAAARLARSSSEIDIVLDLADLSPAAQLVGAEDLDGDGTVTLTIGGSLESPSFSAEAALEFLKYDAYRISSLDGFIVMPDFEQGHLVGAIEAGFSVFNDVPIQKTSLELEKTGDVFLVTADTRIDDSRNGRISARYEERGAVDQVVVDALHLNLDGEIWGLSEEASFEIGDQWSVQTFLLFSGVQQIAFDGHIDPDGEQNLIVTLDQIRLGAFTDLVGYQGVDGTGEGYIVLTGPHDALEMESSVRIQGLKTYGREVGNFDLTAGYVGSQMDLSGRLSHSSGATLSVEGSVPMRLTMTGLEELEGTEPVDLAVKSDSIPLAWMRPFIDQTVIDRVDGYLVCDVQIGGTWDDPGLSGNATVNGGRIRLPEFKLDMRSVAGTFRLDGNRLLVDKLTATSKGGTADATGSLGFRSLNDPTFDLDATFRKFRAISTDTYQVTVSGKGRLTGSMISPVFSGDISMDESDIFMTEELMADEVDPVRLTERDLRILERRFGYRVATEDTTQWDFYDALDLSLEVEIGRDVWFRSYANPKMDVEFSGDLTVSKKPRAEEIVSGTITVNSSRSRVISFARKFEITSGEIQFNGVVDEALVDIQAQYVVPSRFGGDEVKIKLEITGTFGDMRLNLSSEPPMETGAMVSYLTTGRPPGEGSVGGTQAAELAVSSLSNLVEGFANSELGLDVVEIQVNPTRGTSLTVGKYVSPKVYISLTQPLVTNDSYRQGDTAHQTEMAIEYELVSWLVAQLASSRNQLQVNMIWEFAF